MALFALLFVWQFPHFLAIGWIYRDEYQAAGLKMLPSFVDGGHRTALVALVYAVVFVPISLLPTHIGMTGPLSLSAGLVLSSAYLAATLGFVLKRTAA
ncbi:MAG TPA: protoheme IX farnesyltransferase, partial [Polyangiaceae bacterium]|nr:protoheme IX farnesyltransferase [Polyangiaceae bacterium]